MLAPNEPIRLVVGLGNPGSKYELTRHNAGFWFVDALARAEKASLSADRKFFGDVGKIGPDCWLLKPQTFMNRSGQGVAALSNFYQIPPVQILVIHDELDLRPGEVKLKLGGGVAGHNGLKDIREKLGTADFWRLRIGIGHPRDQSLAQQEVVDYVLYRPGSEHQKLIDETIDKCVAAWPSFKRGEMEKAMHQLHTKPKPPKPPRPPRPPQATESPQPATPSGSLFIPASPGASADASPNTSTKQAESPDSSTPGASPKENQ